MNDPKTNCSRRATIYDVAQVCSVSPRTVTRAFQDGTRISAETRAKILEAAETMGYKPNIAATRLAKSTIRITAVLIGGLPLFVDSVAQGFHRAYTQLCDFKAALDVLVAFTPEEIENVNRSLREMLELRTCDGLIIVSEPYRELLDIMEQYRAAGVPIAKMLHCFSNADDIFHVRNDYAMSARMACEMLALAVPNSSVLVFSGSLTKNDIHTDICASFRHEAQKRGLHIAEIFDMHDDPIFAANETERVLQRHPDVKGIYITSANSLEILSVVQRMERSLAVVTSDLYPELAEWIHDGKVLASIFQNEADQAKIAYRNLYEYIAYKKEIPKKIVTRPTLILQSNLEAFVSE